MSDGSLTRGEVEGVISYALGDVLFLKRELERRAVMPGELRDAVVAAAVPALIALEAEQVRAQKANTP